MKSTLNLVKPNPSLTPFSEQNQRPAWPAGRMIPGTRFDWLWGKPGTSARGKPAVSWISFTGLQSVANLERPVSS